jgi:hypothetical protein
MGQKCRKSVSFHETQLNHVLEIENLEQISKEECSMIWFSREEFHVIKNNYQEIILKMRNKELLRDTDEHCTRGLECRSKAGSKRRRDTQLNGLLAVLGEQERQQRDGVEEPETLAVMYRQFSYHSQQAATNMGRRDELEIQDYTADTQLACLAYLRNPNMAAMAAAAAGLHHGLPAGRRGFTSGSPRQMQRNSQVKVRLGGGGAAATSRRRAAAA